MRSRSRVSVAPVRLLRRSLSGVKSPRHPPPEWPPAALPAQGAPRGSGRLNVHIAQLWADVRLCQRLKWVKSAVLAGGLSLPIYPDQRTFSEPVGMSQTCQCTKSLRSSPLRGSKSREAGSRSRGQRWRGGKVNTISSCIVGVQRMIKNSKDHLAGRHPDAASHIDPAITQ